MREKLVLIGAGSAMFTRGLVADLVLRGWEADLALVDIDEAALAVAEGLAKKMIEAKKAPVRLQASTGRRDVLPGATTVICTIGVGGRRAWEKDVFVPRKYGIYQPVGDTVMPGGTSRALRMIPAMVEIARDVRELAPGALFFNYGNPMAPVCRAVRKATGAGMVGLCIGVHGVSQYLAHVLGADHSEFGYAAVGMNHLTWFVEARVRGEDAMPRLREMARKRAEGEGRRADSNAQAAEARTVGQAPTEDNPFCWKLLDLFGAFPAVFDCHVVEFFPRFFAHGDYYGKKLGVDVYSFEKNIARGDRIYDEMRRIALSDGPLGADFLERTTGEHHQALEIIEGIRTDSGRAYSANLPNTGQVPNLPREAVLESPAVATGAGLRPVAQPPLSPGIAGTLATRLMWVETTVEAALEGSRDKFVQALVLDGSVDSVETAEKLADELLAAHSEYLPQFRAPGAG